MSLQPVRRAWNNLTRAADDWVYELRAIYRAVKETSSPWRAFWFLFWPIPWKFRIPPPMSVHDILADPTKAKLRFNRHLTFSYLPVFRARDTPLFALYRLYEVSVTQFSPFMFEGSKYLQVHGGPLKDMPDPKDPGPIRYAALAALIQGLCHAWNWRVDHGFVRGYYTWLEARKTGQP
ncbi:hypothetical protein B0H17DRAFT_918319 [Mycena rosella]|uniref:Uncharacterized protein n=1 Tax=Mycena rosella TaxID=1033263 RepID=A0AAD7M9V5_MYCRO|nr:hypothetical protein B0H17DRAFT_918319 [Mycena rosella]